MAASGRSISASLPYLASKFLVLGVFSAVQVGLLLLVVIGTLDALHMTIGQDAPSRLYMLDYPELFAFLTLLSLSGVAMGLLAVGVRIEPRSGERAAAVRADPADHPRRRRAARSKTGPLYWIAVVASPCYWAYRAVRTGETELPKDIPFHMDYDDSLWIPAVALIVQTTALLLLATWCLRQKDRRAE